MNHTPATDVNALPLLQKRQSLLAKERAPALARSDTHDVGHAEGTIEKQPDNPEKIGKHLVDTFLTEAKEKLL